MDMASKDKLSLDYLVDPNGKIYHLGLLPGEIADIVITVGDPGRVPTVSKHFDRIELKRTNREFVTHTGWINNLRITVISTGIGTGNIDIVMHELDALVNVNLITGQVCDRLKQLTFIRIGTSGSIQPDIEVDSLVASASAFGLDNLMHYYPRSLTQFERELQNSFTSQLPADYLLSPYAVSADAELMEKFSQKTVAGITFTAPGFFSPQGRKVRGATSYPDMLSLISNMDFGGSKITNIEMETAAIYGLAKFLGHKAISFNIILANRLSGRFSKNPKRIIDFQIANILEYLISIWMNLRR